MSNLSDIQSTAFGPELTALLEAHAGPGRAPNLHNCIRSITDIDRTVYDYCTKIEALMKAIRALIDTSAENDLSAPLRHLAKLAEQRANLCKEDVTTMVEEAGLNAVDEDTAVV